MNSNTNPQDLPTLPIIILNPFAEAKILIRDAWPFDAYLSDADLAERRKESTEFIIAHVSAPTLTPSFTCDKCPNRNICSLAYDPYNTDGDCLADK